ncbi:hypothetical protein [Mycobacterium shigaense]|uniref:Uncharacterized protein n=1 Tax=Mycobacterium shigaense TaxID=722731 RepID=A0A1Z4ELZ2_9MYCO|nr:hypothetical protein [Mycobacterium shigaense]MEA1120931.1 hypothetical protein [Mycobacterium shigaense]PRI14688.1 hypothetical protein B2J96_15365 [Mycobacterium shigaense]BAX93968.1 hypothetical protein MSG_03842 [Mycobacterium shigaense]
MKPDEFIGLHREYLEQSDAVQVNADPDGGWSVYIQIGGPYNTPERAGEVAKLIAADLADVYRNRK